MTKPKTKSSAHPSRSKHPTQINVVGLPHAVVLYKGPDNVVRTAHGEYGRIVGDVCVTVSDPSDDRSEESTAVIHWDSIVHIEGCTKAEYEDAIRGSVIRGYEPTPRNQVFAKKCWAEKAASEPATPPKHPSARPNSWGGGAARYGAPPSPTDE